MQSGENGPALNCRSTSFCEPPRTGKTWTAYDYCAQKIAPALANLGVTSEVEALDLEQIYPLVFNWSCVCDDSITRTYYRQPGAVAVASCVSAANARADSRPYRFHG